MTERSWQTARIDDIPKAGGSRTWIPIRKHFDVGAFGVNGWTADEGEEIISEHVEEGTGHQELYFVASGHATFTLDGEEVDGPSGTLVFLGDTGTKRKAVGRIESVLRRPRRMCLGNIQRVKIVEIGFNLTIIFDRVTERHEDVFDLFSQ